MHRYFEFEILTAGLMRVGWAKESCSPVNTIGESNEAYVFDGFVARKWHGGAIGYGKTWQVGDIVGCMLDLSNHTITFSMNGELMMDMTGQEIAFKEISADRYVPIVMLGPDQRARINYGQDPHSLKYYTCCGLQEGYEPFCINMTRPMPLWYVRSEGRFVDPSSDELFDVSVTRVQKSSSNCPAIKIGSRSYGTLGAKTKTQFLRLSLPIKCNDKYLANKPSSSVTQSDTQSYVPTLNGFHSLTASETEDRNTAALNRSFNADILDDDKKTQRGKLTRGSSADEPAISASSDMLNGHAKSATLDSKHQKSKFHFLKKKGKSRDPSPISITRSSIREKESAFTDGFIAAPPDVVPTSGRPHPPLSQGMSETSYGSDSIDLTAGELQDLETNAESIDTYYYGLRLLPGQDPNSVYVGWFTSNFNRPSLDFSPKCVRHVNLGALDGANMKTSISRREMYMVHAGEVAHKYGSHDLLSSSATGRDSAGTLIGCLINVSNGFLTFTLNGRELPNKFQVEPGTKLFPGVIYEPTSVDNLHFEIGRTRVALPISSAMFRGGKQTEPQCPSRLDVQVLTPSTWSRAPNRTVKVHRMKMSDTKGWSMLTEDSVGMLAVHIPEEERCMDALELPEIPDVLNFHAKTLQLYCAICSHGNFHAAHELIKHVDERQLMHAIQDPYLSGALRMGFHDLLNAIHLNAHSKIRLLTESEYVFPLRITSPDQPVPVYRDDIGENEKPIMKTVPDGQSFLTIRPKLALSEQELEFLRLASVPQLSSPLIPLDKLKQFMMKALMDAVNNGAGHIRDPIGGSCTHLFVPILKTIDNLLVMGLVSDSEIKQLLRLTDPVTFSDIPDGQGLLQMDLEEDVKIQLCAIFHHLCDAQVRHRIEALFTYSAEYVQKIQKEQLDRYRQITSSVMSPAIAAKKTKEFRSSPREQMRSAINFSPDEEETEDQTKSLPNPELQASLGEFHDQLMSHCRLFEEEVEEVDTEGESPGVLSRLFGLSGSGKEGDAAGETTEEPCDTLQKLIASTMIKWSKCSLIQSQELVRQMFSLLYRQYDALGEVITALSKTYAIGEKSIEDLYHLMKPLCNIRSLLSVQGSPHEEEILKHSLAEIMDNKIFFQHPDLMRLFCVHETTMQLMVATLNKSQQERSESDSSEMVVMCCKFLCYFCRISRKNQQAMFEHLGYLLENSSMLLVRPSLRGSCPLDVAYSSLMDNNELALALRESHLERIVAYLSRAGVQSNPELLAAGYPDIGWDPVEGERFLDFLRFCVWVNGDCSGEEGESVEENANLVVRLLIRRPECLGPALRGESGGGGLLKAMKYGIVMSEQIAAARDSASCNFLLAMADSQGKPYLANCKYDFSSLPSEDNEDYIDMGSAILSFYSTLVDLLGRCAPSEETIKAGRSDSVRARSILRSLVSMADLEGILSLHFLLPEASKPDSVPPGLTPEHKAAMVMFLERVYGIDNQETFFRLIENGFLADLRTSTTLDTSGIAESDFALALNRYLCGAVLPLLTKHAKFFENAEHKSQLMDSLLHTVYRLSKCRSLTAGQFRTVTDFLVAHTSNMRPIMMLKLLGMLTVDLPVLTENTVISLRMLTHHYERCTTYYSTGHADYGMASDDEKKLTMILFTRLFDALAQRSYEPELFSRALPCLAAIGCALSPDCSVANNMEDLPHVSSDDAYIPHPIETKKVPLPANIAPVLQRFAEHYHDLWCAQMMNDSWLYGEYYDEDDKLHPSLVEFRSLRNKEQKKLVEPAEEAIKAVVAWGWQVSYSNPSNRTQPVSKPSIANMGHSIGSYCPSPVDLKNVTLSRDMLSLVEKVSSHQHAVWCKKKKQQLDAIGGGIHPLLVPYDMLTETEKDNYRKHVSELFKFLQTNGFRIANVGGVRPSSPTRKRQSFQSPRQNSETSNASRAARTEEEDLGPPNTEKRFAYSLLEKLLEYVDKAAHNMVVIQSSKHFTKTDSFNDQNEEIKFFGKVVLLLMNKYFVAHQAYFMGVGSTSASIKEKEMVASLFCKLSSLLRQKLYAFGSDIHITVQCLVCICQAIDARSVVKNSTDIVRTQMTPLFMNAAEDLTTMVENLKAGRFSHIKGTLAKGNQSLDYIHMVVLPVMSSLFNHLAYHNFGAELLVNDIQLACYRILHSLYTMGAHSDSFVQRHRPALGECVAGFAACFPVAFLEPKYNIANKHSIVYQVPMDQVQEHSLEAHEIMTQLGESVPELETIADIIKDLALQERQEDNKDNLHIIEVTLPMLCSYLPKWWSVGPDSSSSQTTQVTAVTSALMNSVLGDVLKLIQKHIGMAEAPWMNRIAMRTQAILFNATESMLTEYIIPMAQKLRDRAVEVRKAEEEYCSEKRNNSENASDLEEQLTEDFQIMVRDLYASYPVLIRYVDLYRSGWIKEPHPDAEILFEHVAKVFNFWSASNTFRRAETTFVNINEINNMTLIMPSSSSSAVAVQKEVSGGEKRGKKKSRRREGFTSLVVAAIKRLLPIGLNVFGGPEQELVQLAKEKMIEKEPEIDIEELLRTTVAADNKKYSMGFDPKNRWQKALYLKMGKTKPNLADLVTNLISQEKLIEKIMTTAKVLYGLHLVEHPLTALGSNWKKVISTQRKKAVMACFRMVPLHNLHRHRAINLFLAAYSDLWLDKVDWNQNKLIEDLTAEDGEDEAEEGEQPPEGAPLSPDPLRQLVQALSRQAQADQSAGAIADDQLYIQFTNIMGKSCSGEDEDDEDDDGGGGEETLSFQEQEMQKQKLLFEQGRLANRAASEMLLLYISASKGVPGPMVSHTIDCGIALLLGGNADVQQKMLEHLQEKKDVGFFIAMSGFMQQCSVLDLDAFERTNKAESLGVVSVDGSSSNSGENLQDADFTCKLFRFLQLLCEGHNANWQNYLRTQVGNNTTVNLIISTVDYLLRIQESMMDFYWHYSGKDTIDEAGKANFIRAIKVGKQLFAALTEYIQGPCQGNQLTLAHSRLWDAVGGFLFIFAHMQDKLSRDPEQLELLREFMNLQKEMMIMLLSMLEGNVMNGPIGKQMVDTLVESSANFEMILKFFDIFLKMKDMTTSEAFLEYDLNKDGYISPKEFRIAMYHQKLYAREEIDYIMMCVDANKDGKVDFLEFTERFHNPAKDIGFNVALLLTNLAEHMPNDPRLERFLEKAKSVLDYFEPYLGRIEIMGSAGRIERVYFEITQSHINQWEKPQIKESKRYFLHNIVNEEGDNEKIESFVGFCEDTIFEMQHATSISAEEQDLRMAHAKALRAQAGYTEQISTVGLVWEGTKTCISTLWAGLWFVLGLLTITNIKHGVSTLRSMTFTQLLMALLQVVKKSTVFILKLVFTIICTFFKWILAMMMGEPQTQVVDERIHCLPPPESYITPSALGEPTSLEDVSGTFSQSEQTSANADETNEVADEASLSQQSHDLPNSTMNHQSSPFHPHSSPNQTPDDVTREPGGPKSDEQPSYDTVGFDWGKYAISFFARNFYNFKMAALTMAFAINFLLLFYRVTTMMVEVTDEEAALLEAEDNSECEVEETIAMKESDSYLEYSLQLLALVHTLTSLSMLIAYYCLKVPLVIFKREKSIARKLEFEGMWIAEEPGSDELKLQWDRLVLSTRSFPAYYWDKFVKKKVKAKYSEQFDPEEINALLAIEKSDAGKARFAPEVKKTSGGLLPAFLSDVDWKYEIWKWGVILSDNNFLYLSSYLLFSFIGNYNHFFYAAHLMDVAFSIKTLGTILQSVTHNGKQLILTVMLTSVVVYIYSVIAFNFFRKFYAQEGEEGDGPQYKCNDLLTCFVFHLHTGVRAGGGIGDEIESADGDPSEVFRNIFDISFFFFVIVILLAIIQGLIIDAFGELRSQLEQVKEDMESSCFICGIGKDYFDEHPHGFERHVMKEHNFANYMFFLMHLINKPDTEYTGQETYVWEMYNNRCWDFFPVGDCFRKQYDSDETTS